VSLGPGPGRKGVVEDWKEKVPPGYAEEETTQKGKTGGTKGYSSVHGVKRPRGGRKRRAKGRLKYSGPLVVAISLPPKNQPHPQHGGGKDENVRHLRTLGIKWEAVSCCGES